MFTASMLTNLKAALAMRCDSSNVNNDSINTFEPFRLLKNNIVHILSKLVSFTPLSF